MRYNRPCPIIPLLSTQGASVSYLAAPDSTVVTPYGKGVPHPRAASVGDGLYKGFFTLRASDNARGVINVRADTQLRDSANQA